MITHTIKLSSGKEIELTDDEYREIQQEFKSVEYVPYPQPVQPSYPGTPLWPEPWCLPQTWITTSDTVEVKQAPYGWWYCTDRVGCKTHE